MAREKGRDELLSIIYYQIGRQSTNYNLQHSRITEEGDHTWTRRKTFLDIDPQHNRWFVENANHRQILKNEIILDFDRVIPIESVMVDKDIRRLLCELDLVNDVTYSVWHTGSKGVHVHIYLQALRAHSRRDRERLRRAFFDEFEWFSGVDKLKASDAHMIALEHTPHWRTGRMKTLVFNGGVREWE